ncbi:major facilitator superfamily domain-containing protein [Piptocephalis cylindrospora]|uniref:Major facilitator superfamily domain-containing protein n=1 Tax=Piptocephalis cylindrospora TaxID=1907219 RepID=A0A4P9Y650_9FUNG|nr:major facilitator superfamily domain-containing protein [Piptocephalis cylindrospora]|eukprot:RKP14538.1 major facilitator superfamily domain-containing protein [Piptocephalis cylindrospora]
MPKASPSSPISSNDDQLLPSVSTVEMDSIQYRTYPLRWVILLTLFLLNMSSSILWTTYTSVSALSAEYFEVSDTAISMLAMVFYIGFVIMSLPSGWVIDHVGIKTGLIIGSVLNIAGAWLRYVAVISDMAPSSQYAMTMASQCIAALGQPFFLNAPTKFAASWFTDRGRGTANTIATLSNPIGIAVGQLIVPALAPTSEDFPTMLLVTAVIATASCIPLPLISSMPPSPPQIEVLESTYSNNRLSRGLRHLLPGLEIAIRSPGFLALWFVFSSCVGTFSALTSLLNNILTPYGYSADISGIFGAVIIVGGLIGAAALAILIDRVPRHILILRVITPISAASFIGFIFAVKPDATIGLGIVSFLIGISTFSLLPIGLELGVECTYPAPEGTVSSLLWMGGQAFSAIYQVIMNALRWGPDKNPPGGMRDAIIFSAVVISVSALVACFGFHGSLRRRAAEKELSLSHSGVS